MSTTISSGCVYCVKCLRSCIFRDILSSDDPKNHRTGRKLSRFFTKKQLEDSLVSAEETGVGLSEGLKSLLDEMGWRSKNPKEGANGELEKLIANVREESHQCALDEIEVQEADAKLKGLEQKIGRIPEEEVRLAELESLIDEFRRRGVGYDVVFPEDADDVELTPDDIQNFTSWLAGYQSNLMPPGGESTFMPSNDESTFMPSNVESSISRTFNNLELEFGNKENRTLTNFDPSNPSWENLDNLESESHNGNNGNRRVLANSDLPPVDGGEGSTAVAVVRENIPVKGLREVAESTVVENLALDGEHVDKLLTFDDLPTPGEVADFDFRDFPMPYDDEDFNFGDLEIVSGNRSRNGGDGGKGSKALVELEMRENIARKGGSKAGEVAESTVNIAGKGPRGEEREVALVENMHGNVLEEGAIAGYISSPEENDAEDDHGADPDWEGGAEHQANDVQPMDDNIRRNRQRNAGPPLKYGEFLHH